MVVKETWILKNPHCPSQQGDLQTVFLTAYIPTAVTETGVIPQGSHFRDVKQKRHFRCGVPEDVAIKPITAMVKLCLKWETMVIYLYVLTYNK